MGGRGEDLYGPGQEQVASYCKQLQYYRFDGKKKQKNYLACKGTISFSRGAANFSQLSTHDVNRINKNADKASERDVRKRRPRDPNITSHHNVTHIPYMATSWKNVTKYKADNITYQYSALLI